ncbi:MAG: FAD-dependent oxidoreductase, partial [Planctomycetaceae bacterium]|nr:FAD-dependent oxidoreductase [Planctomycetaceae bacterium]
MTLSNHRPSGIRATGFLITAGILIAAVPHGAAQLPVKPQRQSGTAHEADVIVYGGTSAGVVAAIQTSRMGKQAILIEPTGHLGGMTANGLGWTDTGDKRVIGGIAREFYRRIRQHYDQPESWSFEKREDYDRYRPGDSEMWTFEPHVAENILQSMLNDSTVQVVLNQRLDRSSGVRVSGNAIQSISMESGETYSGRHFIDATYEGDLMAAAGVTFTVGREANERYGETLNGNQVRANTHNHRFVVNVSPYQIPGDPDSGLIPEVVNSSAGIDGDGDHRIQAFCYRMCMTRVPQNRVPFPRPSDYDERQYELLFRNFEAGDLRVPMSPGMLPNGKTDTNNNGAVSTDFIGANYDYADATYEQREQILARHESWQKGLMWTLTNHPRVPESVRKHMAEWGLAADEFRENGNWPYQIYVREARRMVSDYVTIEQDCRRIRVVDDAVGMGSYNMDSHNVRRFVTPDGFVQNEGDVQVSPGGPYLISYRSIIPRSGEIGNLLVPICLSSSHIAYGSIRMEPVFMILGQSAATAAVLSQTTDQTLHELPFEQLRARLLRDGQVLDLPPDIRAKRVILPSSLPGVVLDDDQAELTGAWSSSSSVGPYVNSGYRHDGAVGGGQATAVYRFDVPETG